MARIWSNRLEEGTQFWTSVPAGRRAAVLAVLKQDVADRRITAEQYQEITGEIYEEVKSK